MARLLSPARRLTARDRLGDEAIIRHAAVPIGRVAFQSSDTDARGHAWLDAARQPRQRASARWIVRRYDACLYSGSMADVCIFCGGTPGTREHLWPDWLRREAAITDAFDYRIEQEANGVETRNIEFSTPPFSQVVRAVCAVCNGGWMSTIEVNAKPILQNLIHRQGRTLGPDDKRKIATWAFLKACVFDELHPQERAVPAEHRKHLFMYGQPPATGVAIWLGTYEAEEVGHYAYQGLRVAHARRPAPEGPSIYIVTITAGTLIVQVAGSLLADLGFDDLNLPSELHVAKVWPESQDIVVFAQDYVMDHETLVGFTKLLYNVMSRLTGGAPPAR